MPSLFPRWQSTVTPSSCYTVYGSTNHAGTKKAASIFLKSRKFITAWFINKCVATTCGTAEEHSAMHPISTYNVGEKLRKWTSVFWFLRGAWAPSAPPLAAILSNYSAFSYTQRKCMFRNCFGRVKNIKLMVKNDFS